MGTRIPLPDNNRSGLFEGLMAGHQTRHARDQLQQQANQFDKKLEFSEKQLSQAWKQHEQNLALHQQQERRLAEAAQLSAELHPLQLAQLRASIGAHQAKTKQLQQKQTMLEQMLNGTLGQQSGGSMQGMPEGEAVQPTSMGEGVQLSAPPPMDAVKNGFKNLTGPQAAFVKKETGFDPFAESPQEKRQAQLDLHKQKKEYEAEQRQNLDRSTITEPVRTQAQKTLIAANSTLGLLDELIKEDVPGAIGGKFTPDQKAIADALSNLTADDLMTIFSLPKDKHSTELVEQMTKKQFMESDVSFKKRLKQLKTRIDRKVKETNHLLDTGKISSNESDNNTETEDNDPFGLRKSK